MKEKKNEEMEKTELPFLSAQLSLACRCLLLMLGTMRSINEDNSLRIYLSLSLFPSIDSRDLMNSDVTIKAA